MKRVLFIVLGILFMFSLTGCSKNEFDIGEKSDIEITQNDVTLTIKEGTLTNTGATIVLTNNSDKSYIYGNPYQIEIKKNGEWHKINVELYFTEPAFGLGVNEIEEIEINWEYGYGKLAKGTYRILKDIDYKDDDGIYEMSYIAAEFTIE